MASSPTKTIAITNFTGALTRTINGDVNSGLAKFMNSWGYDPFSQPGNLTWNYQTSSVNGILNMPLAGIKTQDPYFYMIDSGGRFSFMVATLGVFSSGTFNVLPFNDSFASTVALLPDTYNYGAGIATYQGQIYTSGDSSIRSISGLPTPATVTSVAGNIGQVGAGLPHPLAEFQGKLYYGNANNIGEISAGIVTTGQRLSPALPSGMIVTDLDVTPQGDYLLITASFAPPPYLGPVNVAWVNANHFPNSSAQSEVFYWNGSDTGATAVKTLPSFPAPALSTFLDSQYTVTQDTFGMALMEGSQKLLTLPGTNNPSANALSPNGTFLTWVSTEGVNLQIVDGGGYDTYSSVFASLYYFGKLDEGNATGLWRMDRISPINGNYTMQYAPFNQVINNFSFYGNEPWGYGKHYISTQDAIPNSYSSVYGRMHVFALSPGRMGLNPSRADPPVPASQFTAPTQGVYETQTQLFSKRIGVAQIRVYCDPTVAGNKFQLDLIGSNGTPIPEGTFTYTYGDIVDPQDGSISVERINFPGNMKSQYSLGIRLTNLGTTNMVIRKVELDINEEGK